MVVGGVVVGSFEQEEGGTRIVQMQCGEKITPNFFFAFFFGKYGATLKKKISCNFSSLPLPSSSPAILLMY